jgi:colanic acid biosynthesis glycosyl transferase WcaI
MTTYFAVNRFYRPDHAATAQMLTDLAEHLSARGLRVHIITSRLRYDGGPLLAPRETLAGVEVTRVWTTHFGRAGLIGRAIDYASFYVSAFLALVVAVRAGDVVIAKTDPPLISVVAGWACRLRGARLVNWCQDLFPEIAAALGLRWASGPFGGLLRWLRNRSLKMAAFNAVLNTAMAQRLRAQGLAERAICVLPNWADADVRPISRLTNPLRTQWGLSDRFVIGYSGNLGRAHLPDAVADLVRRTKDLPGLVWLFIGPPLAQVCRSAFTPISRAIG